MFLMTILPFKMLPVNASAGSMEKNSLPMAEFYVSPEGNDNAAGTATAPFKTIEGARNKIRKINGNMTGDIVVNIKGGTYTLDHTLEFTSIDTATNGYRIIYKAATGEKPVISGGETITGWKIHDAEKNIYKASVPKGHDFRQLYVNGERAVRAQNTASGDYSRIADVYPMKIEAPVYEEGFLWISKSDIPAGMPLNSLKGAEIHEIISWTDNVLRIESATEDGENIKLKLMDPEESQIFNRPHPWVGYYTSSNTGIYPYYLANAYELIDTSGEWFLDRKTATLYYKASEGTDMNDTTVIAPMVETLVNIEGTLDKQIEGLSFEGLTFEYSNWTYPSEHGFVNSQSGLPIVEAKLTNRDNVIRPSAAIHVGCTKDLRFENNTLTNLGNMAAIDLEYATTNSVIKNNLITKVSGNGIMVARGSDTEPYEYHNVYNPPDLRNICNGDKIINNRINNTGLDHEGTCGIFAIYPRNITIANNEIDRVPYTGISVGYGWSNKDNAMSGNVILRNKVSNHMCVCNDGGAIYTLSKQPESVLAENYIFDLGGGGIGVYNDEKTSGYTIARNVSVKGGGYGNNGAGSLKMYENYIGTAVPDEVKNEVFKNAGNADYLNYTDEPFSALYNVKIKGAYAELSGYFNLNTLKCVVFAGANGTELEVPLSDAVEANVSRIVCVIPEGAEAGPVFVRGNDGIDSGSKLLYSEMITVEYMNEGFEEYAEGDIDVNENWASNGYSEIIVDDTEPEEHTDTKYEQMLQLKGPASGNGTAVSVYEYPTGELQFDFYFANDEISYNGIYVAIGNDRIMINPGFSAILRIDTVSGANITGNEPVIKSRTWYTCRFIYDENEKTRIKIWEKADSEPGVWNISANGIPTEAIEGKIKLTYFSPNTGNIAYIDNVVVKDRSGRVKLEEDFNGHYEGVIDETNKNWEGNGYSEIVADESRPKTKPPAEAEATEPPEPAGPGHVLKLRGPASGNGTVESCGKYALCELKFDFYFTDEEVSYHGLYVLVGNDRIMLCPGFGEVLRADSAAGENISGTGAVISSKNWYTCRFLYDSDGNTKIKVWKRALREPGEWNFTSPGVRGEEAAVKLGYHSPDTGKAVYIDNVIVKGSDRYVLELPDIVNVESVSISLNELTLIAGEKRMLTAKAKPSDATYSIIKWSSSDEEVVTVTNSGRVTGLKPGKAVVTAAAGGKSASCEVTVKPETYHEDLTGDGFCDFCGADMNEANKNSGKLTNKAKTIIITAVAAVAVAGLFISGIIIRKHARKKKEKMYEVE